MRKSEINNKEKAPPGTDSKVKGFTSRHDVRKEALTGIREELNMLQVKFNSGEGN